MGSVPFGLILARAFAGVDVRAVGSGNIGASNVSRAAGKLAGVVTLLFDAGKAALPMILTRSLLRGSYGDAAAGHLELYVGVAAFVGHCFPVWLRFKGGKGVATGLGVFAVLAPLAALAALVSFGVVFAVTRIASVSSLVGTTVCAGGAILVHGWGTDVAWGALLIAALIFWRHRGNLARLFQKREIKV
ncbi:glycerol-3-phosphate 1-O-acyltransferase PlsY [Anaeromyxobacter paludicola]